MLREDLAEPSHPSDGDGRAWLVPELSDVPAVASQAGRWTIEFEVGDVGIEVGGMVFLQVSPFWGWSSPQVLWPDAPGFTEVTTSAEGVVLDAETIDQQLLGIRVEGRRLEPGETMRIGFGAGTAGALPDRYSESESRFWIAVDGNGDGRRKVIPESPAVKVLPGKAAGMLVHVPSTAAPGEMVRATIAMVDGVGNRESGFAGAVELSANVAISGWPVTVELTSEDRGARRVEFESPPAAAVVRITASTGRDIRAESNPLVVGDDLPRVLWADLHGHSGVSDGTGTPADYFSYARDVSALDVVALTDHDHWGIQPLAPNPDLWHGIRQQVEIFYEPGSFVALLGFEWTNWIYGHRHVLYFSDDGQVLSSVDRRFEHPRQLWDALRGKNALTVAHHSAGGPVATDWTIAPDENLEPVTEVASVHGSSEAPDSPYPIYRPLAGNYVRDALDRGYRFGFLASGDGHDGHPGMAHLTSPQMGGVAAILAAEPTRDSVFDALRGRRTYATNGPRILLRASLDGLPMGSVVTARTVGELFFRVVGVDPLETVDVVRSGRVTESLSCGEQLECSSRLEIRDLGPKEYLYVRAVQVDGGAAWSSPFFIE
jgi:hypothetical protein